jgi:hypothetical protein
MNTIPPTEAYYLGYIVEDTLRRKVKEGSANPKDVEQLKSIDKYKKLAMQNHDTYLTYDHMDVYIATSMRQKHEFVVVREFIAKLFSSKEVSDLNLRWFDPTLAYCFDRIDKGLVEALMVKRALCTIYHVQEADTFGKDSELAATLAQGKPVIAYIPQLKNAEEFIEQARLAAKTIYPEYSYKDLILKIFLPIYYPSGAWENEKIRGWLNNTGTYDENEASHFLFEKAQQMYDDRAKKLKETHPLGLQVNLDTGVANGVLVVRTVTDCARLLRSIVLNEMEFELREQEKEGKIMQLLEERISGCIYRAVTGDELLTNTFWNYYLRVPSFPWVR